MSSSSPIFHTIDTPKTSLAWISNFIGSANLADDAADKSIVGCSSAANPRPGTLSFVQSLKKLDIDLLGVCAAVICTPKLLGSLPNGPTYLCVDNPHNAFAAVARELYPYSAGKMPVMTDVGRNAFISSSANIAENVHIAPGAVIGENVAIGEGSHIGANATIADNCQIGRNCSIGPSASVQYSLIGDGVTLHAGVRVGQDGFGFVPGSDGLEKMPQLGRVIIQDNVEIGANTTIDRGTLDDTVIGEGTKIDNLVQVGHNVVIGRNCAIAGFVGLSGSSRIGDGCLIGGRVGIADHVKVGNGVQLAATSSVMNDIPDGEKWAGTPAQPFKAFFREQATLRRLAKPNRPATDNQHNSDDG